MAAVLEVRGLHAQYGSSRVLHGMDFGVEEGGITTILGANGAGKTTTLRAVCGMVKAQGEIVFAATRIDGRSTEGIVRMGVAHVPDGRGTFVNLSVEENLRLGAYTRRDKSEVAADFERVYDYFPRLRERQSQLAGTLSGGEQQMVAIGRALMGRPGLLLLDEPSVGIAHRLKVQIFAAIRQIQQAGTAVLLVEQDALSALRIASRLYVLEHGRMVREGAAAALSGDDYIRQIYLGV